MLSYDLSRPDSATDGATVAVLLHGRGSHRGDLQGLRPHLPSDWVLVTPEAPHAGRAWGYGPGWAWYRYAGDDRVAEDSLAESLAALDDFLLHLNEVARLAPGQVVLGGFSQGGTTSMAYAIGQPGRVAGVLNFSGFLPDSPLIAPSALSAGTAPVFWGHGTHDPNIPHALAVKGRARLTATGVPLTARDYEIGHWIDPMEVRDAVTFAEALRAPST
jgi:phospholipase/carboxylesterase